MLYTHQYLAVDYSASDSDSDSDEEDSSEDSLVESSEDSLVDFSSPELFLSLFPSSNPPSSASSIGGGSTGCAVELAVTSASAPGSMDTSPDSSKVEFPPSPVTAQREPRSARNRIQIDSSLTLIS